MKTQLKVFRKARKIKFRRRLSRRNMLDRKETEIPEECQILIERILPSVTQYLLAKFVNKDVSSIYLFLCLTKFSLRNISEQSPRRAQGNYPQSWKRGIGIVQSPTKKVKNGFRKHVESHQVSCYNNIYSDMSSIQGKIFVKLANAQHSCHLELMKNMNKVRSKAKR